MRKTPVGWANVVLVGLGITTILAFVAVWLVLVAAIMAAWRLVS